MQLWLSSYGLGSVQSKLPGTCHLHLLKIWKSHQSWVNSQMPKNFWRKRYKCYSDQLLIFTSNFVHNVVQEHPFTVHQSCYKATTNINVPFNKSKNIYFLCKYLTNFFASSIHISSCKCTIWTSFGPLLCAL